MRLYSTSRGIAREDRPGELTLLGLPHPDLGALLRAGELATTETATGTEVVPLAEAELRAPVWRPGKVPIIGLNYRSHTEEVLEAMRKVGREMEMPKEPNFHLTPGSAVNGPDQPILLPPAAAERVDYEGEIAAVIGAPATRVDEAEAWSHVAGLTIANDVSARDIQIRAMMGDASVSVGLAKSFDTFKPLGPCLLTADEFSEPLDLALRTTVNGELRQDAKTDDLIYQISELVAYVSRFVTLEPGDVLCTGSPQGSGQFSGRFLAPGDVVEVTVDPIGTLRNPVAGT